MKTSTLELRPTLPERLNRLAFGLLLALLVWAPIPLASNRSWSKALLAMGACVLLLAVLLLRVFEVISTSAAAAGVGSGSSRPIWLWPLACLALVQLLVLCQLLPLPASVRQLFVPGAEGAGWVSADPFATRQYLMAGLSYLAAFLLVVLLVDTVGRIKWLLLALVLSGGFQAMLGAVLLNHQGGYTYLLTDFEGLGRATGTFSNFDHLAFYLELCLAVGFGLLLSQSGTRGRPAVGWRSKLVVGLQFVLSTKMILRLLLVMMVVGLVLTRSRAGNGAFLFSLLAVGVWVAVRSPQLRKFSTVLVVSMLLIDLVILGQWVGLDKVLQRMEATALTHEAAMAQSPVLGGSQRHREESLEERWYAARYALGMVEERPWLGFGGWALATNFPRFKGDHPLGFYDHLHNDYVQVAVEAGLPALLLMLAVAGAALYRAARAVDDQNGSFLRGISAGLAMAFVSAGVHLALDFNLQIPANAFTLSVLIALVWCGPFRPKAQRKRRSKATDAATNPEG